MNLQELLAQLDTPIVIRPTRRMTQGELETYLDKAADILRGNADHSEFRGYVFALLFYKRISDCYDEEVRTQTEALVKAGVPRDQALLLARDPQNHHDTVPEQSGLGRRGAHRQGSAGPGLERGHAVHRAGERPPSEQLRRDPHRQDRPQQTGRTASRQAGQPDQPLIGPLLNFLQPESVTTPVTGHLGGRSIAYLC
jgi:hypothetical protein